jgi:hypothetical protein
LAQVTAHLLWAISVVAIILVILGLPWKEGFEAFILAKWAVWLKAVPLSGLAVWLGVVVVAS